MAWHRETISVRKALEWNPLTCWVTKERCLISNLSVQYESNRVARRKDWPVRCAATGSWRRGCRRLHRSRRGPRRGPCAYHPVGSWTLEWPARWPSPHPRSTPICRGPNRVPTPSVTSSHIRWCEDKCISVVYLILMWCSNGLRNPSFHIGDQLKDCLRLWCTMNAHRGIT